MTRIATDVVLLPDRIMTARAIEINERLVCQYSSEIALNGTDCLPHISLAMGCIEERQIGAAGEVLERLAQEVPVRQLTAIEIRHTHNSQGEVTVLLEMERTQELQTLHERVMEEMERFFNHDVTSVRFYDDVVTETTLDWVRNYPQKAGGDRFSPHITLGYGQVECAFSLPVTFAVERLALCHLGNHATCRKVLTAIDL